MGSGVECVGANQTDVGQSDTIEQARKLLISSFGPDLTRGRARQRHHHVRILRAAASASIAWVVDLTSASAGRQRGRKLSAKCGPGRRRACIRGTAVLDRPYKESVRRRPRNVGRMIGAKRVEASTGLGHPARPRTPATRSRNVRPRHRWQIARV